MRDGDKLQVVAVVAACFVFTLGFVSGVAHASRSADEWEARAVRCVDVLERNMRLLRAVRAESASQAELMRSLPSGQREVFVNGFRVGRDSCGSPE